MCSTQPPPLLSLYALQPSYSSVVQLKTSSLQSYCHLYANIRYPSPLFSLPSIYFLPCLFCLLLYSPSQRWFLYKHSLYIPCLMSIRCPKVPSLLGATRAHNLIHPPPHTPPCHRISQHPLHHRDRTGLRLQHHGRQRAMNYSCLPANKLSIGKSLPLNTFPIRRPTLAASAMRGSWRSAMSLTPGMAPRWRRSQQPTMRFANKCGEFLLIVLTRSGKWWRKRQTSPGNPPTIDDMADSRSSAWRKGSKPSSQPAAPPSVEDVILPLAVTGSTRMCQKGTRVADPYLAFAAHALPPTTASPRRVALARTPNILFMSPAREAMSTSKCRIQLTA